MDGSLRMSALRIVAPILIDPPIDGQLGAGDRPGIISAENTHGRRYAKLISAVGDHARRHFLQTDDAAWRFVNEPDGEARWYAGLSQSCHRSSEFQDASGIREFRGNTMDARTPTPILRLNTDGGPTGVTV